MDSFFQSAREVLEAGESALGLAVLFLSSVIEYIFPPFPGDTITLFGAFLAANFGWSVPLVFGATLFGSVVGASIDYGIGRRLALKPTQSLTGKWRRAREKIEPILEKLERRAALTLALNRFFPGIRALFFVAAGMAKIPWHAALLWAAVSTGIWNALIIAMGIIIGRNWERLLALLQTYFAIAWIAVIVLVAVGIVRYFRHK